MPNSRHSDAIVSPSLSRITNRIRSSTPEPSFHGILLSAPFGPKSVTHVSGTFCYPCLGTDSSLYAGSRDFSIWSPFCVMWICYQFATAAGGAHPLVPPRFAHLAFGGLPSIFPALFWR